MAVIDPDGFYNGDRLAMLSDAARLHWPHLFLLCNGHGRFEINPRRILDRAYGAFKVRPTQDELAGYIREYREAYLLFVYESAGQLWGQWDVSEKFLPRHKTAHDMRTPAPCAEELFAWKTEYAERKCAKRADISFTSRVFGKPAQDFREASEDFGEVVQGGGGGVGKPFAQNGVLRVGDAHSLKAKNPSPVRTQAVWFEQFWSAYWRKRDRKRAFEKFKSAVRTEAVFSKIMGAVAAQSGEMLAKEPRHRPHAATWLTGERWEDEADSAKAVQGNSVNYELWQDPLASCENGGLKD